MLDTNPKKPNFSPPFRPLEGQGEKCGRWGMIFRARGDLNVWAMKSLQDRTSRGGALAFFRRRFSAKKGEVLGKRRGTRSRVVQRVHPGVKLHASDVLRKEPYLAAVCPHLFSLLLGTFRTSSWELLETAKVRAREPTKGRGKKSEDSGSISLRMHRASLKCSWHAEPHHCCSTAVIS